ncbi:dynein axonemal assembly factor 8 isoform X2 [Lepisosteus oculatus]|uniref:dynein axonemal assembly factor 8 isoform X2 n=1 Tax=Lepisosteus oculatus TaxID=7918 RepID=UPI0035F502B1
MSSERPGARPDWDSIFASVKDFIPSLDSDTSSGVRPWAARFTSDCEEDVPIFRRTPATLLPGQPENPDSLSLGDAEVEELLESVRTPVRECWTKDNPSPQSTQDELVCKISDDLVPGTFEAHNVAATAVSVQINSSLSARPAVAREEEPATNHQTNADTSAAFLRLAESPSLACVSVGAQEGETLGTSQARRPRISGNCATIPSFPASEINLSVNSAGEDCSVQNSGDGPVQDMPSRKTNVEPSSGFPVLSLESFEQWDLDEVLQTLKQNGHLASSAEDVTTLETNTVPSDSAVEKAEGALMEKLTALCVRQNADRLSVKLKNSSSQCPSDLRSEYWTELQVKRRKDSPTVHIDLRNPDPPKHPFSAKPLESPRPRPTENGKLTGKCLLLRKLRETNRSEACLAQASGKRQDTAGGMKDLQVRAPRRKKEPCGTQSTSEEESQPQGVAVKPPQSGPESEQNRSQEERLLSMERASPELTETHTGNKSAAASKDAERREQQKENIRRQKLHQHLETLKPKRSVTGRQPAAHCTNILYDNEASYLPSISTLSAESEHRETLLLTVSLASLGQVSVSGRTGGQTLDMALSGSHVYNSLVAWFLSLVGQRPLGRAGEELHPPFWVAGLQQLWREDGLALYVCAASPGESLQHSRRHRKREGERSSSVFYQRVCKFLSQTSLHAVVPWAQDLNFLLAKQSYPLHINVPSARLDSFICVNPERKALEKAFGTTPGFYWQTVEIEGQICESAGETADSQHPNTEVAMAVGYSTLFEDPLVILHTLQLLLSSNLDVCGLRLLYPTHSLLKNSTGCLPSGYEQSCAPKPVLALAFRGPRAAAVWLDITGPSDPRLASLTDPNSINATHCSSSDRPLFYTPRLASRIQWGLCIWFGGRVPLGGTFDAGPQNSTTVPGYGSTTVPSFLAQEEKCGDGMASSSGLARPPAALCSTITVDVFLLVSPAIPPCCYGDVLTACVKRGYNIRGLQRLQLTPRRAQALGLTGPQVLVFCSPPPFLDVSNEKEEDFQVDLPSHCLIVLLRREHAWRHCSSLLAGLMKEFAEQGLLSTIGSRLPPDVNIDPDLCFHPVRYSDSLLHSLGGSMWSVPEGGSIYLDMLSVCSFPSNPEVEQVVILTLTSSDIEGSGLEFLRKILRGEASQAGSPAGPNEGGFELLATKWLPELTRLQAREVSPFEVGDRRWRDSLAALASVPALVCALRRVNAFAVLRQLLKDTAGSLDRVMSPTPELAFRQAALFFTDKELLPDHSARPLLRFLPPPRKCSPVPGKQQWRNWPESVFSCMVEDPEPLLTVALFKPGVWCRPFSKILSKVRQSGFSVVGLKLVVLDTGRAAAVTPAAERQKPDALDAHVQYLTSGPSLALGLQRENAVKRLLDLLGPEDPCVARAQDQFLWRAHYGTDLVHNGVYGSRSYLQAIADVKMFFPEGLCCAESTLMKHEEIPCVTSDLTVSTERIKSYRIALHTRNTDTIPLITTTGLKGEPSVRSALCQTTCLLIPAKLLQSRRRALDLELVEQLLKRACHLVAGRLCVLDTEQSRLIEEALKSPQESTSVSAMLANVPCLILALQGDNAVTCFESILDSICLEKPELMDVRRAILYPYNEKQAAKLLCCLFDSLSPDSLHSIVPQDTAQS